MVYRGDTMAIGVKGEVIAESEPFVPQIVNVELDLSKLKSFREKFPVWKDADEFVLEKITNYFFNTKKKDRDSPEPLPELSCVIYES